MYIIFKMFKYSWVPVKQILISSSEADKGQIVKIGIDMDSSIEDGDLAWSKFKINE